MANNSFRTFAFQHSRVSAVRWNWDEKKSTHEYGNARDANNHGIVRATTYDEVSAISKMSGSFSCAGWQWHVIGAIDSDRGVSLILPGDWIVRMFGTGLALVMSDETFNSSFVPVREVEPGTSIRPEKLDLTHLAKPNTENENVW